MNNKVLSEPYIKKMAITTVNTVLLDAYASFRPPGTDFAEQKYNSLEKVVKKMDFFLITVAPPLIIVISLAVLFIWVLLF
ncbi:MAG TPA: hypothetical protein VGE40_08065 [Bacilli bacterium]